MNDESGSHTTERRFKEFYTLNEALEVVGYEDLPLCPAKLLIKSQANLDKRQRDLNLYCKELLSRKDLRSSREVIVFFELNRFAPELLFNQP
mmetsp:Transcript_67581/g.93464  ORF Transcript_67581/g.93464 Transcript_67581/m.93464 type:complete len:92 (-) Transcript_67581:614-889(-)